MVCEVLDLFGEALLTWLETFLPEWAFQDEALVGLYLVGVLGGVFLDDVVGTA